MFGLTSAEQISAALKILGTKKRIANKMPCPCSSGKSYSRCKCQKVLERYRQLASRRWFKEHAKDLGGFIDN
jgi:hypothetical protein